MTFTLFVNIYVYIIYIILYYYVILFIYMYIVLYIYIYIFTYSTTGLDLRKQIGYNLENKVCFSNIFI